MNYEHLSQAERYQIYILKTCGHNQAHIAKSLGRSKSTISRELKRGRSTGTCNYQAQYACELAKERAVSSRNAQTVQPWVMKETRFYLSLQWSPEQIAGKLPISHETVYRHIYADKAQGGQLYKQLRCKKRNRKRYASGHERRGRMQGCRSIHERPAHVQERKTMGHWEGDTVIGGNQKGAIVTMVERKSGYAFIAKVSKKTAKRVRTAIVRQLHGVAALVKTITFDNGKEFADHVQIDKRLGSTTYFADPFASWQRGSNENFNGLLRQYVPKKRLLSTLSDEELQMIQDRLNHRPRKRLGFKSPHEVFHQSLNRVALRV